MEQKRRLTITPLQDHEFNPAQLLLRNSSVSKEAKEWVEKKKQEEVLEQQRRQEEIEREREATTKALEKGVQNSYDRAMANVVALSIDEEVRREWVKQWAVESAAVYLDLLFKQELGDLIINGKLDITAAAHKLGMRYQSLYQLVGKNFSPRLETLGGIAAVLGYAVEVRFISIEEAVEHEACKDRLTLQGEVKG